MVFLLVLVVHNIIRYYFGAVRENAITTPTVYRYVHNNNNNNNIKAANLNPREPNNNIVRKAYHVFTLKFMIPLLRFNLIDP